MPIESCVGKSKVKVLVIWKRVEIDVAMWVCRTKEFDNFYAKNIIRDLYVDAHMYSSIHLYFTFSYYSCFLLKHLEQFKRRTCPVTDD